MFNNMDFELHDSIATMHNKRLLESENAAMQRKNNNRANLLSGLSSQYTNLYETSVSDIISNRIIAESAIISAFKDVTYQIFEAALLIDDEPKIYYGDVIKATFNQEFENLLKESKITNLSKFRDVFGNSNSIYAALMESVSKIGYHNMGVYTTILENSSNSEMYKMIIEACEVFSESDSSEIYQTMIETCSLLIEADAADETRVSKIKAQLEKIKDQLAHENMNTFIKTGMPIKIMINLILQLSNTFLVSAGILNPVLSIVWSLLSLFHTALYSSKQGAYLEKYLEEIADIKKSLTEVAGKVDKDSKEHKSIQKKIERCDALTIAYKAEIEKRNLKKSNIKTETAFDSILESAGTIETYQSLIETCNLLIESENADTTKINKVKDMIEKIKEQLSKESMDLFIKTGLPIKILIAFIAQLTNTILVASGVLNPVLSIVLSLMSLFHTALYSSKQSQYLEKYLDEISDIRKGLVQLSKKVEKDSKEYKSILTKIERCDNLTKAYKTEIAKRDAKNIKTESAMDDMMSICSTCIKNSDGSCPKDFDLIEACNKKKIEAASESIDNVQVKLLESIDCAIDMLNCINDDCFNTFTDSMKTAIELDPRIDNQGILLDTVSKCITETGVDQGAVFNALGMIVEASTKIHYNFLQEDTKEELEDGDIPSDDTFFSDDEKEMFDKIASIHGKNFAIQKIKDKVVQVISDEEKAATQKQEEDTAFLNSMSSDDLEDVKDSISESAGMKLGSAKLNMPDTLFSAIIMNRSKKMLTESAEENPIMSNKDTILAESVVLYTIHETFNTLNLRNYNPETTRKYMNNYYYNKI